MYHQYYHHIVHGRSNAVCQSMYIIAVAQHHVLALPLEEWTSCITTSHHDASSCFQSRPVTQKSQQVIWTGPVIMLRRCIPNNKSCYHRPIILGQHKSPSHHITSHPHRQVFNTSYSRHRTDIILSSANGSRSCMLSVWLLWTLSVFRLFLLQETFVKSGHLLTKRHFLI